MYIYKSILTKSCTIDVTKNEHLLSNYVSLYVLKIFWCKLPEDGD